VPRIREVPNKRIGGNEGHNELMTTRGKGVLERSGCKKKVEFGLKKTIARKRSDSDLHNKLNQKMDLKRKH
jgi:hypothetical protein